MPEITIIPKRAPLRLHVNGSILRANARQGKNDPPLRVQRGSETFYGYEVTFRAGRMVYRAAHPLPCGARLWIETDEPVTLRVSPEGDVA